MPILRISFSTLARQKPDGNSDSGHDHHNDGVHRIDHVLNTPGFGPIADAVTYDAARAYWNNKRIATMKARPATNRDQARHKRVPQQKQMGAAIKIAT